MESEKSVKLRSWLILFSLTLVWGSSFILIKRGMMDASGAFVFSPFQLGALRIILAGITLLPVAILRLKRTKVRHHFWLIMVGLIGNTIPAFLFAYAETKVPSAVAGMLNSTTPIFVFIIGMVVFKMKFSKVNLIGILIGSVGAFGLVYFGGASNLGFGYHRMLLIVATICYAASVNIIKMKLVDVHPVTITALSLGYLMVPCMVYLFSTDFLSVMSSNEYAPSAFMYVAILSVIGTSLALVLFNYLVKEESALFASSVTYLIPIVAIFWGLLDGEIIENKQIAMIFVILGGVFAVNYKAKLKA